MSGRVALCTLAATKKSKNVCPFVGGVKSRPQALNAKKTDILKSTQRGGNRVKIKFH